jgi:hypothetical protein
MYHFRNVASTRVQERSSALRCNPNTFRAKQMPNFETKSFGRSKKPATSFTEKATWLAADEFCGRIDGSM